MLKLFCLFIVPWSLLAVENTRVLKGKAIQAAKGPTKEVIVYKDKALVRFPGKVVYWNRSAKLIKALNKMQCLKNSSLLNIAIGNDSRWKELKNYENPSLYSKELERVLNFEKLKAFNYRGSSDESFESYSAELLKITRKKCGHLQITKEIGEFLRLEFYLKERFLQKNKINTAQLSSFVKNIYSKLGHEWMIDLK